MLNFLFTILLAYILFPLTTTSSTQFFIEAPVSLWPEAIEASRKTQSLHHQQDQQQRQSTISSPVTSSRERVVSIDTAHFNLNTTYTSKTSSLQDRAAIIAPLRLNPSTTFQTRRAIGHAHINSSYISVSQQERVAAPPHNIFSFTAKRVTMPAPKSSRHQARIIRETSRDFNGSTIHSVASSTGSNHGTVSDRSTITVDGFDPEGDSALESSYLITDRDRKKLPDIRDTAKKYGRWEPRPAQPFAINTSALGRAFPDFSQGLSVVDDTFSLEGARGNNTQRRASSKIPQANNVSETLPPNTFGNYNQNISTTPKVPPPKKTQMNYVQTQMYNNIKHQSTPPHYIHVEQKENVPPNSQKAADGSPYISHASRTVSGEKRSLAELHARVTDDSDGSILGGQRPATITLQSRNTRFSNTQPQNPQPAPVPSNRQQSADALAEAIHKASDTPSKPQQKKQANAPANNPQNFTTPNPTQQSFMIPTMPASSEQGTGTFTNGLPVFTQQGKVQSRNSSARSSRHGKFGPVDGIEVPEEEEDIYELAQMLREKVAQLELERAEFQLTIDELKKDNNQLALEKKQLEKTRGRARADSGLGDSGSDHGGDHVTSLNTEKASKFIDPRSNNSPLARSMLTPFVGLQAHCIAVQNQLNAANQKIRSQELVLKTNSAERDDAVKKATHYKNALASEREMSQRTIQENEFLNREHIIYKNSNDTLREQNESLRKQLAKFTADNEENTRTWQSTESALRGQLDQVIAEKEEKFHILQEQEAAVRTQLQQILVEREEDSRKWQQKEADLRNKLQRQHEAVKYVTERAQQIQESTQTININSTTTRTSSSVRKSDKKHKSGTRAPEQALPPQNQEDSFHENTIDVQNDNDRTQDSAMSGSNFSSILGSGFMQNLNQCVKDTKAKERAFLAQIAAEEDATIQDSTIHNVRTNQSPRTLSVKQAAEQATGHDDTIQTNQSGRSNRSSRAPSVKQAVEQATGHDDTIQTNQSGRSNRSSRAPSVKAPSGILKNGGTSNQEDLASLLNFKTPKSSKTNDRVEERTIQSTTTTHRRTRSEVNEDHTTRSNTSHRRNHSEGSVNASKQKQADADDMTSAYLLVDIEAAAAEKQGKQHPVLSASARQVLDGLCKHNIENCTICARVASIKKPVRIEKPVPVSKREDIPYEDEPTIRPVIGPGIALATVIKELQDEITHLKMEHAKAHQGFISIDPARSKRQREKLGARMSELAKEINIKSDQVYQLYDVVEAQHMFDAMIDDKELPWEGIEDDA
jgi:hypothetical protein